MLTIVKITTCQILIFFSFVLSAVALCIFVLACSFFLGERSYIRREHLPFESGINSVGTAKLRLSVKFYLIAMFFVIFDVETLYLYAWSETIRETGWFGFTEAAIFIFIILCSLGYLVRVGAFNWTSEHSK